MNNLNETLLARVDEKNIMLNFKEELELAIREIKYFFRYGFKNLPESMSHVTELSDELWVKLIYFFTVFI